MRFAGIEVATVARLLVVLMAADAPSSPWPHRRPRFSGVDPSSVAFVTDAQVHALAAMVGPASGDADHE